MNAFALYSRYAFRSFLRGRSRSFFGAFCVAVGVASAVAMGLAAANFRDSVTANARQLTRGDVSVQAPSWTGFTRQQYAYFGRLKREGQIVDYTSTLAGDGMLKSAGAAGAVVIGETVAVEPAKFPFYDTIRATRPAGRPLAGVMSRPNDAVVTQDVFDQLHLRIGGSVTMVYRLGGVHTYRVAGIVADNARDPAFGGGIFNDYIMVNRSTMGPFIKATDDAALNVYLKTVDAAQAAAVKQEILTHFHGLLNPKTVADVARDSKNSAAGVDKFFALMGLVAVIIGGIGIINTMLVATRRRLREIAVLKSLGMKGRQVVVIIALEALILGVAGTVAGLLMGVAASTVVNNATQSLAGYSIPWSLHARPLVAGSLVGVLATVLFAYLPAVRASRARPIAAIRGENGPARPARRFRMAVRALRARPMSTAGNVLRRLPGGILRLPRRQGLRTALLVLLLAALMGYGAALYTGLFSGPETLIYGALGGVLTLVAAGILTQIFVAVVWLVSKLPTFGSLSLRMALRSMGTQKRRMGSTLLALCVGILSMGTITIVAQNIKHQMSVQLEQRSSFNVVVQSPHNPALVARIQRTIAGLPGVTHRYNGAIANQATLSAVDGVPLSSLTYRALHDPKHKFSLDQVQQALSVIRPLAGYDVRAARDSYVLTAGRNLNAGDAGTNRLLVTNDFASVLAIHVGSRVVYTDGARKVSFTVVGIVNPSANFMIISEALADLSYLQRSGLTGPSPSHNNQIYLQIDAGHLKADTAALRRAYPGALVLEVNSFLQFTQVIDKVAALPEVMAALALFAGAIIIANTVALAMLERRREFGVMKAVGARRSTILRFLFVENAIVGLLGAAAGAGLATLAATILDQQMLQVPVSLDLVTPAGLLLLGMALAVAASALTALPASSEKPLTVLRYE